MRLHVAPPLPVVEFANSTTSDVSDQGQPPLSQSGHSDHCIVEYTFILSSAVVQQAAWYFLLQYIEFDPISTVLSGQAGSHFPLLCVYHPQVGIALFEGQQYVCTESEGHPVWTSINSPFRAPLSPRETAVYPEGQTSPHPDHIHWGCCS